MVFEFEQKRLNEFGPCECCAGLSRSATGMVRRNGDPYALYRVHWTANQIARHGAEFYIVLGRMGEGTTAADKIGVAVHYFVDADRSGFMVVDAAKTPIASDPLIGRAMSREDVVDTYLSQEVFDLLDAIWLNDENISEITTQHSST